jgi:hypothetical protein
MGELGNWLMGDPAGQMRKAAKTQQAAIDRQTEALKNQPIITEAAPTSVEQTPTKVEMGYNEDRGQAAKRRKTRRALQSQNTGRSYTGLMF